MSTDDTDYDLAMRSHETLCGIASSIGEISEVLAKAASDPSPADEMLARATAALEQIAEIERCAAITAATHQSGLQVGRWGDLAVHLPVYEAIGEGGWVQWDPARCALRRWVSDDYGAGWWYWVGAYDLAPPTDETLCRTVPRGEADASPMSRGQLVAPKAEG
jgi:hypothetical protein